MTTHKLTITIHNLLELFGRRREIEAILRDWLATAPEVVIILSEPTLNPFAGEGTIYIGLKPIPPYEPCGAFRIWINTLINQLQAVGVKASYTLIPECDISPPPGPSPGPSPGVTPPAWLKPLAWSAAAFIGLLILAILLAIAR